MENLNIEEVVDGFGLSNLSDVVEVNTKVNSNINPNSNQNQFNNFKKVIFSFNNIEFELGISFYSNVLFIIITSNSKLGSFWMGEFENKDDMNIIDPTDNIYEIQCLLGNRKDESNQFLCNSVISYIFSEISNKEKNNSGKFAKINKVLLSTTIKFEEILPTENQNKDKDEYDFEEIVIRKEFKEFLTLIKNQIAELIF